jgi:hypothetical protein
MKLLEKGIAADGTDGSFYRLKSSVSLGLSLENFAAEGLKKGIVVSVNSGEQR